MSCKNKCVNTISIGSNSSITSFEEQLIFEIQNFYELNIDRVNKAIKGRDIFYNDLVYNDEPINTKEYPVADTNLEYLDSLDKKRLGNKVKWKTSRKIGEEKINMISSNLKDDIQNIYVKMKKGSSDIVGSIKTELVNELYKISNIKKLYDDIARDLIVDGFSLIVGEYKIDKINFKNSISKELYDEVKNKEYLFDFKVKKENDKYYAIKDKVKDISFKIKNYKIDEVVFDTQNDWNNKEYVVLIEEMTYNKFIKEYPKKKSKFNKKDYLTIHIYKYYKRNSDNTYDLRVYAKHDIYENDKSIESVSFERNDLVYKEDNIGNIFFYGIKGFKGRDNNFGDPISDFTGDLQIIEEGILNGALDNIWIANVNRTFVKKGALSQNAKIALESGSPYIEVNARSGSIRDVIFQPQYNAIPSSVLYMLNWFENKNEETINKGANVPTYAPSSNFALAQKISSLNVDNIVNNVIEAISYIFKRALDISEQELTNKDLKELINIDIDELAAIKAHNIVNNQLAQLNDQGVELNEDMYNELLNVTIEQIHKEILETSNKYDIEIEILNVTKTQEKIININNLLNVIAQGGLELSPEAKLQIGKEYLRMSKLGSLANELSPIQPNPVEIQKAQAEAQKMIADAEKSKALAENSKARTQKILSELPNNLDKQAIQNAEGLANIHKTLQELGVTNEQQ